MPAGPLAHHPAHRHDDGPPADPAVVPDDYRLGVLQAVDTRPLGRVDVVSHRVDLPQARGASVVLTARTWVCVCGRCYGDGTGGGGEGKRARGGGAANQRGLQWHSGLGAPLQGPGSGGRVGGGGDGEAAEATACCTTSLRRPRSSSVRTRCSAAAANADAAARRCRQCSPAPRGQTALGPPLESRRSPTTHS